MRIIICISLLLLLINSGHSTDVVQAFFIDLLGQIFFKPYLNLHFINNNLYCNGHTYSTSALAAFREVYPGKSDNIEQAVSRDWTKEAYSSTCERLSFPMGELNKFWPEVMKPYGRIHFAGAYADNLNWGMEASTRSANRVVKEINEL